MVFENILVKRENVRKHHDFFPTVLFAVTKALIITWANFNLSSAYAFSFSQPRILLFGKGLQ